MRNINQVIIEGNISCDPELRFTNDNQKAVTNFNLYVDSTYKSKSTSQTDDSGYQKRTSKIPVVAWANKAQLISEKYRKGDKVRLIGHIKTRKIQKEGVFFNAFEIVADEITLIRRPNKSN